jgi:hypothetical protein
MINARVSGRSWRKNLAGISTKGARAVNGRDRIEREDEHQQR